MVRNATAACGSSVTRTNTCPYSVHPGFKFYSGHQLHYGFSSHSSVPPQNASNCTTTASFHTLLGYWELLCAFPHTASRNEVQISGAPYSPDITDGYVNRPVIFVPAHTGYLSCKHSHKGGGRSCSSAVTDATAWQPSEGKPSLLSSLPYCLIRPHYRLMESQKLNTFVAVMILTLISTPYVKNNVI